MRLPIPIFAKSGKVYTDVDIIKPKGSVIADTRKIIDTDDVFTAMKVFLSGCITSVYNDEDLVEDKVGVKGLAGLLPYRSAEYVMIQIMILLDPENDYVEGIYKCPRCGNRIISELSGSEEDEIDTRDLISSLECNFMDDIQEHFAITLNEPVSIINKATKEVLEEVESVKIGYSTIQDCIVASRQYSQRDQVRLQFATYVESLSAVNGNDVDKKYRFAFGMIIFENIKDVLNDIGQLNREASKFGINPAIKKICNKCDKEFKAHINMSSFFVSGLDL
jgi:DNA-directed RNA polymerase subunit RPC12/RpoP